VGFGISNNAHSPMIGSEAVIGYYSPNGSSIKSYVLLDKNAARIMEYPQIVLTGEGVCVENGYTVIKFTKTLDQGRNIINLDGVTQVVMAYGNDTIIQYHQEHKVAALINFMDGNVFSLKALHIFTMIIGWAILYIGSFYISFSSSNNDYPKTIRKIHSVLQIIGSIIVITGFCTAIAMISKDHFSSTYYHSQIGIVTIALTFFECIVGFVLFFSPVEEEKNVIKTLHKWVGWGLIAVSMITIGLGIFSIFKNFYNFWFGIYLGALAAMLIMTIINSISSIVFKTEPPTYEMVDNLID